jgi:4-diphosphocytidyl-2C-methyl-D-erythritol kinase
METCITTRAPAKINVTLEVIGKLSDDYHHIRSVLVKLYKLADVIDIRIGAE